ncbi:hypothetical protein F4811DRAFT_458424 [Daldinia bambusicola]|nr:hypothetical protein F4811DRAFT_458424 [Daldinia bambusicola]
MESLSISDEPPSLTTLPADILYIVLTYLDTAKSVANLAASCKGLHHLVTESGWRIFVTSRFSTFKLSQVSSTKEWSERAFSLTSQSRDWDRRAFAVSTLKVKHNRGAFNRFGPTQSIPSNIIVDAHHRRQGDDAQDLVFWGAGEDIFGLLRHTRGPKASNDEWLSSRGATAGYRSGKDDVTCVSILKDSKYNYGQEDESQVLVGRASGYLHLLSMGASNFGNAALNFRLSCRPASEPDDEATRQTELQSLDVNYKQGTLAAATKQSILTYSLNYDKQAVPSTNGEDSSEKVATPHVWADDSLALKDNAQLGAFEFIRSIKFVNGDTLAVGLNKGYNPLQYLKYTPTGVEVTYPAKASNSHDAVHDYKLRTVRAILPVDTNSLGHGRGNVVLSSWDDGTIRLQDLRTPSAADQIFQDNFDLSTPTSALLSRGLECFVAGGAYYPVLKVFDYRWSKGYYHTEALPCGNDEPYPAPRPPTIVSEPSFSDDRVACDYITGKRCRWHELSRHDFYRPNFNMWLPSSASDTSPIYTLASPSDDSPTLFAGISGMLVKVTPKSSTWPTTGPNFGPVKDPAYVQEIDSVCFIETGSGYVVDDVSQSQRVPVMYRQFFRDLTERDRGHPERAIWRKRHRLDEWWKRCL